MKNIFRKYKKSDLFLLTTFILFIVGFILSGYLYFANYKKAYNTIVTDQLSLLSELKVGELVQWRKERLLDAAFFYNNTEFSSLVKRYYLNPNDGKAKNGLKELMSNVYNSHDYDAVFLLDKQFIKIIIVGTREERKISYVSQRSSDSIAAGKIVFEDVYYNEQNKKNYLKVLVPIYDNSKKNELIGIVALRIDPNEYLYPFIQRWPSDSKSGETILIRREGNEVVYISQLRFKSDAAHTLRFDIEKNKELPAAKAVSGKRGIVKGIDYRGIDVTADIRAVPDSPWFIIAKMDDAEMYASYRERLFILVLLIILLMFGTGVSVGFVIKKSNLKNLQVQIESAKTLSESEERFRAIVENIGEGIAFVNSEEKFLFVNSAAEEIFGVESGKLTGMDLKHFVSDIQYKAVQKETLQRVQGNKSVYELKIVRPNGEERNIIVTAAPRFDKEKGFAGTYGVFRDITEKKKAEENAQKIHQRYRELVELAVDGILVGSHEGIIIEANSYFCTMTGKYREELIGRHISEVLFTPVTLKKSPLRFDLLQQGETVINERNIMRPDGSEITIEMRTKMMPDGTYQSIYRDITDRKKAEEILQIKERYQRALLDNFPFAVWLKDTESRFLAVNELFAKTFKALNAEVLVGKSDFDIASRRDAEGYRADDRAVLASREKKIVEEEIVDQGERKWFETYKAPVIGSNNELLGTVGFTRDISERKRVEDALKENEKFLRETQIIAELGTYTMDIASGKWKSSEILDSIFGIDSDYDKSIEGWSALIHPEWQKMLTDFLIQEVIGKKKKFDKEYQIVRQNDKSVRWVSGIGELKFNDADQPITLVGTIKDITERKRSEELLLRERNLLRTLIDNLPDKVHLKDIELRYQLNNIVHLRTLGVSRQEESIGKTVLDFFPLSHVKQQVDKEIEIIISGKQKLEFEEQFFDKEKKELQWYLTSKIPVLDHLKNIVGLLTISRNITDRKKIEDALQESERKFRTLFENMTEGVALHEMIYDGDKAIDYRILDINPAYEKHTGLSQTHARGLLASELYGTGAPPYLNEWADVAITGTPYTFETFFAPLNRHFSINVISPGKGYFATVFEDITDRIRKEQDLREKNSELERFTYTVSHDLKSPLITIKGFSGGLLKDLSIGRQDRLESDLKRINDAADKMSGLLNDLLELSRIGRIVNPPSDIAFDTLAHEVVTLLSGSITNSKAKVVVQEGLPVVRADRRRLFEVIQNLVENALKFMGDQRDPRVEIGVRNDGGEQVFFVRDNGKGIDPRYHETIFGLFNKLDASTEGTGIGLALARRIIEVHGGKIWVESEGTNRGATFYFTLSAIQPKHT